MKIAIWILSIIVIILAFVVYFQWTAIQNLTPSADNKEDERSKTFGEMVNAFQKEAKEISINATF